MLPYVAIGYGKRSAEAAGLNRTINPPPYYGKRSAEAVGLPAAPVADAAYVRKEVCTRLCCLNLYHKVTYF